MFSTFQSKTQSSGQSVERELYSLDETLTIMEMINGEKSLQQIAKLTGRTVSSIRYRFKDPKRGVQKILADGGPEALFTKYNETYVDEADVQRRINDFKAKLIPVAV